MVVKGIQRKQGREKEAKNKEDRDYSGKLRRLSNNNAAVFT